MHYDWFIMFSKNMENVVEVSVTIYRILMKTLFRYKTNFMCLVVADGIPQSMLRGFICVCVF